MGVQAGGISQFPWLSSMQATLTNQNSKVTNTMFSDGELTGLFPVALCTVHRERLTVERADFDTLDQATASREVSTISWQERVLLGW